LTREAGLDGQVDAAAIVDHDDHLIGDGFGRVQRRQPMRVSSSGRHRRYVAITVATSAGETVADRSSKPVITSGCPRIAVAPREDGPSRTLFAPLHQAQITDMGPQMGPGPELDRLTFETFQIGETGQIGHTGRSVSPSKNRVAHGLTVGMAVGGAWC